MAILAPESETMWFDPNTPDVTASQIFTKLGQRRTSGNTVALPVDLTLETPVQRFLLIGGFTNDEASPTDTCEIFENDPVEGWRWRWIGDPLNPNVLNHARGHADAQTLLDGQIFLVGGGEVGPYSCPILTPEIFDPATETWTALTSAKHQYPRMYHSTVALQRDGSVWVGGQDETSTCPNESWTYGGATAEIYYPWYCSDVGRPSITAIDPSSRATPFARSGTFDVEFSIAQGRAFEKVAIAGLSATTHSLNTAPGYVILESTVGGGPNVREVTVPLATYAPPGVYMLVVVDDTGSPSVAEFIYLGF